MTKLLILFSFILMSCSHLPKEGRSLANLSREEMVKFEVKLSSGIVFANGADAISLSVAIYDEAGNVISVKPGELKILSNVEIEQTDFKVRGPIHEALIRPKVKSPDIRLIVAYKEKFTSQVLELQTTLTSQKDLMEKVPWSPSVSKYVSGVYYGRSDNFTPDRYESFVINNYGNNRIVNTTKSPHAKRDFSFDFEQQVTQNNSILVNDSPNEFTSHGMYSHMMLFPRTYLPHLELDKEKANITLPTGEKMIMDAKSGEVIGGVFSEGPVDTSGDRFKRHYADLKYQGKGILLRANARGQMPQQGQFENLKIDMEYGIRGSMDVLIINGTTGQRCRRPKTDFWPSGDISPIPFKFPTDKEFDAYLRSKCQFGIPELDQEESKTPEDSKALAQDIWNRCESASKVSDEKNYLLNLKEDFIDEGIRSCLNSELGLMDDKNTRSQVAFDLYPIYLSKRLEEKSLIDERINLEAQKMRNDLINNISWIQDETLNALEGECKIQVNSSGPIQLKFNKVRGMNAGLICQEVIRVIQQTISADHKLLRTKLTSNLSWLNESKLESFAFDCKARALSLIDQSFHYSSRKSLYSSSVASACKEVEKTEGYTHWLQQNLSAMENKAFDEALVHLETLALKQGKSCLDDYPMNNVLQRIRFKVQRENCVTDEWDNLENEAVSLAFKDPIMDKVGVSRETIKIKLTSEGRRLQLKVFKTYFTP